jgi:hypothetical protein
MQSKFSRSNAGILRYARLRSRTEWFRMHESWIIAKECDKVSPSVQSLQWCGARRCFAPSPWKWGKSQHSSLLSCSIAQVAILDFRSLEMMEAGSFKHKIYGFLYKAFYHYQAAISISIASPASFAPVKNRIPQASQPRFLEVDVGGISWVENGKSPSLHNRNFTHSHLCRRNAHNTVHFNRIKHD